MIIKEKDYLEHHGVKGMKWYQHIFGRFQSNSKYAEKSITPEEKEAIRQKRLQRLSKIYDVTKKTLSLASLSIGLLTGYQALTMISSIANLASNAGSIGEFLGNIDLSGFASFYENHPETLELGKKYVDSMMKK